MQRTWCERPRPRNFFPTCPAVSPPTLASTSSKIRIGISSTSASVVFTASITRAISPLEAIARRGRAASPRFGAAFQRGQLCLGLFAEGTHALHRAAVFALETLHEVEPVLQLPQLGRIEI